jgi:hypothetical protein
LESWSAVSWAFTTGPPATVRSTATHRSIFPGTQTQRENRSKAGGRTKRQRRVATTRRPSCRSIWAGRRWSQLPPTKDRGLVAALPAGFSHGSSDATLEASASVRAIDCTLRGDISRRISVGIHRVPTFFAFEV